MDIVIAAAGQGTRLRAYTTTMPKHIIPINGRPFLYYLLDAVFEANFRRVLVVGGHGFDQLIETIHRYQTDEADRIILVNQFEKIGQQRYGTACPVMACRDLIQGDRFVYTMGDHLISARDLIQMQQSTRDLLVAVTEHPEPQRYGVVEYTPERTIARIVEKPTRPSSYINVGLYTLSPAVFPIIEQLPQSTRNEYEMTDVINQLAAAVKPGQAVRPVHLQDQWLDLGRPEDIVALERFLSAAKKI